MLFLSLFSAALNPFNLWHGYLLLPPVVATPQAFWTWIFVKCWFDMDLPRSWCHPSSILFGFPSPHPLSPSLHFGGVRTEGLWVRHLIFQMRRLVLLTSQACPSRLRVFKNSVHSTTIMEPHLRASAGAAPMSDTSALCASHPAPRARSISASEFSIIKMFL